MAHGDGFRVLTSHPLGGRVITQGGLFAAVLMHEDGAARLKKISTSELLSRVDNAASFQALLQAVIDPENDLATLERTSLALASRLELAASSTCSNLDSLLSSTSHSVPRLAYDISLLRDAALDLRSAIQSSQIALQSSEQSVDSGGIGKMLEVLKP